MQFIFGTGAIVYSMFAYPLLYILPAYVANGAPVLFGGGKPIDFNKKLAGKRIFGNHKTIKGVLSALIAGIIIGIIEYPFMSYMLYISVMLSIGAIVGDLVGSFAKRRFNIKEGASVPLLDQYGFFIFAVFFALPLGHLPDLYGIIFIILLTGVLHILTNIGANRLRLKAVPW